MHLTIELPSGIYLADLYGDADRNLEHRFTIFHRHNYLKLAEVTEAVLKIIRDEYLPHMPEVVEKTRIVLVQDSLWATLSDHLRMMEEQEGVHVHQIRFSHSPLYGVRDHAGLAIAFMKLMNLREGIEVGLEGLLEEPVDGALVSVLSCLQMVSHFAGQEGTMAPSAESSSVFAEQFQCEMASVMAFLDSAGQ